MNKLPISNNYVESVKGLKMTLKYCFYTQSGWGNNRSEHLNTHTPNDFCSENTSQHENSPSDYQ